MKTFYVWITTLLPDYTDKIVSELVRRECQVSSISSRIDTNQKKTIGNVVSLQVASKDDLNKLHTKFVDILNSSSTKYFSLVIVEATSCIFSGSNIGTMQELDTNISLSVNNKPKNQLN